MNDFTKEELQWISNTLGYYEGDGGLNIDEHDICESVHSKLQSMIDNYKESIMDDLYTFKQFVKEQKIFSEAALRNILFLRDKNGLQQSGAIINYGKKILIHKTTFFNWFTETYSK